MQLNIIMKQVRGLLLNMDYVGENILSNMNASTFESVDSGGQTGEVGDEYIEAEKTPNPCYNII